MQDKPYIMIQPSKTVNMIEVHWMFNTKYKVENSGKLVCYINGFNIYFSAQNFEAMKKKSLAITAMFFDHFLIHSKNSKRSMQNLVMQLHKLGFKATNDAFVIKELINNHSIKAKFNSQNEIVPHEFHNAENISQKAEMEVMA